MKPLSPPPRRADDLPFSLSLKSVNRTTGYIALFLPLGLWTVGAFFGVCSAENGLNSISHYYFARIAGDLFVGALLVIAVLLAVFYRLPGKVDEYLAHEKTDLLLLKVAGVAALLVALIPTSGTGCEAADQIFRGYVLAPEGINDRARDVSLPIETTLVFDLWASFGVAPKVLPYLHYGAAAVMFAILGYYCLFVFTRAQSRKSLRDDGSPVVTKTWRNRFYRICGAIIFTAMAALLFGMLTRDSLGPAWSGSNLTFWFEAAALMAFGFAWLVKGRFLWVLEDPR
ncbi:MAG: hypothetical protein VXZ18_10430 [Pseudomonadota bacterium]|nr:hypothetical protein [Pseudomonadota bacterium]